jgi:phage regulator Rha-like protein
MRGKKQENGRTEGRGGRRYRPYAFTEYGAIMAATVLNSKRAVQMSVFVVRAFVRMREALATNQRIVAKQKDLENWIGDHDAEIQEIVATIREMDEAGGANRKEDWVRAARLEV